MFELLSKSTVKRLIIIVPANKQKEGKKMTHYNILPGFNLNTITSGSTVITKQTTAIKQSNQQFKA